MTGVQTCPLPIWIKAKQFKQYGMFALKLSRLRKGIRSLLVSPFPLHHKGAMAIVLFLSTYAIL